MNASSMLQRILAVVVAVTASNGLPVSSTVILFATASTAEAETGDNLTPVEPKRWRGRYVSPSERRANPAQRLRRRHERTPDAFEPGVHPAWARLEVIDSEGRPMFDPRVMDVSSTVRYADRDQLLGMNISIIREMHPQPIMTVNTKVYAVTLKEAGWRRSVNVFVDVGVREYEREWFDAMKGRIVTIVDGIGYPDNTSMSETLRVKLAEFGTVQKIVFGNDGKSTSNLTFEGRLTLRETWSSFLGRQLHLVLENSFVILATAIATGVVTILLSVFHTRLRCPSRSSIHRTRKAGGKSSGKR